MASGAVTLRRTQLPGFWEVAGTHPVIMRTPAGYIITNTGDVDGSAAGHWRDRAQLTHARFPTLREARSALAASIAVDGPPPSTDTTPLIPLVRVRAGQYRTRDGTFTVTRRGDGFAAARLRWAAAEQLTDPDAPQHPFAQTFPTLTAAHIAITHVHHRRQRDSR